LSGGNGSSAVSASGGDGDREGGVCAAGVDDGVEAASVADVDEESGGFEQEATLTRTKNTPHAHARHIRAPTEDV
jgi:hypothetical protein